MTDHRPTIAISMGEPAGIGPEVIVKALADPILRHKARYIIYGMNELLHYAADLGASPIKTFSIPSIFSVRIPLLTADENSSATRAHS